MCIMCSQMYLTLNKNDVCFYHRLKKKVFIQISSMEIIEIRCGCKALFTKPFNK